MSVCKTCCSHSVTDRSHNTPTLYKHSSENEEPKAGQQTGEVHVQLLSPNHATTVCFLEASLMREKENHSPTSGRISGCKGKNSVSLIRRDNSCPDLPVHKHKTLRQILHKSASFWSRMQLVRSFTFRGCLFERVEIFTPPSSCCHDFVTHVRARHDGFWWTSLPEAPRLHLRLQVTWQTSRLWCQQLRWHHSKAAGSINRCPFRSNFCNPGGRGRPIF